MNTNTENIAADHLRASPRGYRVKSPWLRNVLTFLVVFGPGLIVMEADNDAGAVSTYTQAGGQYGLYLLWLMRVIIERVWNQFFDSQTNVVNVYVNHLRSKIDLPGLVPIVQTVRGVGFALRKAGP